MTSLTRLDNTLWGYELPNPVLDLSQIQIRTPHFCEPGLAYNLSTIVQTFFQQENIQSRSQLDSPRQIVVMNQSAPLAGTWEISLVKANSLWDRIASYFPFTRSYPDKHIAQVTLRKMTSAVALNKPTFPMHSSLPKEEPGTYPFTLLAKQAFQTASPFFVSEEKVLADFRYVLEDSILRLVPLSKNPPTAAELAENRAVVAQYKNVIISEYGIKKYNYIMAAYGFSLDELLDAGAPLVCDHVFKTNIGTCNIELSDVQELLNYLIQNKANLQKSRETSLPLRPQRIIQAMSDERYNAFVAAIPDTATLAQNLPADFFNILISIVMPGPDERKQAMTGRAISHLAIQGSNTMGDPNIFNPSRDLFELMHLYDQMHEASDWQTYFQLAAHVASKKSLFRKTPFDTQGWHVGILLPAPKSSDGTMRWYYNSAFYDDGQGNVNYLLVPACNDYEAMPCIKNYRSTASNRNAIDWMESIAADLNPYGSPGSIDPDDFFSYEKKDFYDRTIPLWVAKLLYAEKSHDLSDYKEALSEYALCVRSPGKTPQEILERLHELKTSDTAREIRQFLRSEAEKHKELEEFKIQQDIACIGHSLGGALAQFGAYYFLPRRRRIPLPGCTLTCFASRDPAIDDAQNSLFMRFGEANSHIIQALNGTWKIIHDFEYGDFVPESGHSHLGTPLSQPEADTSWLDFQATVFKPLDTATRLEITTLHTHDRRQRVCVLGQDYSVQSLSRELLAEFDHRWVLTARLTELFGYRLLRSAKITEFVREAASVVLRPFMIVAERINNLLWPPIGRRNKTGGFALHYGVVA